MNSDILSHCFTSYLHRLADTTFYEFIPCDLLKLLLFFKFIHSIKFRAARLKISGDVTMNFGQHDSGSGLLDFGRDDFRAT